MADYTLTLGRIPLVSLTSPLKEQLGDGFDAVGAVLTGAEPRPRPAELVLPVRGPAHRRSWQADGQRLRRQLRAMLENATLRSHGMYLSVSWDPEFSGWLMVGSGELGDDQGMGPAFADWLLTLGDTYRVGSLRTTRPGRRVEIYDRRTGTAPRDFLRKVYSTAFSTMGTRSLIALPTSATDVQGVNGRVPVNPALQAFPARDGNVPIVTDAAASEVLSYNLADPANPGGDVVAVDRRGRQILNDGGHSYVSGYGLTPTTARYPQVLTWEGQRATNYTTALAGAVLASSGGAGYNWYCQYIVRGTSISLGNVLQAVNSYVHGWGQNDLPQYGSGNMEPIMEGFRRVLARSLAAATHEESDAAWTHTGGTARSSTDKNSGTGWREAAAVNDKHTITIPADYSGGRVAVAFVVHGAATGTVEARLDGTLVASWSLGGTQQASSSGWNGVVRYLPPGTTAGQVLELKWTALTGSSSNYPGLDCIEWEADTIAPVWVFNHNRLISYSAYSGSPFPPNDAAVNLFNARLKLLVESEYPWPVAYVDADAALNKNASYFQADNVHPNEAGHQLIARAAIATMNPAEEMPGPDFPILYPANDPPALDNGRVIVNYAGSGIFRVIAWDWTAGPVGGWVEQGRFLIERIGDSTGICSTMVSTRLIESSTERTVVEVVLRNNSDANSRERVIISLDRAWTGPRVEVYPATKNNGTAADVALSYYVADADTYDTAIKLDNAGGAGTSTNAGSTFTDGTAIGASTFDGENWVYLSRVGRALDPVFAVTQTAVAATVKYQNLVQYGASRNGIRLATSGGAGYLGPLIAFARHYTDSDTEAESWTLDGTAAAQSDAAASPGSGNSRVQSNRTSAGNTISKASSVLTGQKYLVMVRCKVDSPATGSFLGYYYLSSGTAGTTTSTSYVWVSAGIADGAALFGSALVVRAWRSSGASGLTYLDRVVYVPLESRYGAGDFQGARDVGQMLLADTRQVPVLVAR